MLLAKRRGAVVKAALAGLVAGALGAAWRRAGRGLVRRALGLRTGPGQPDDARVLAERVRTELARDADIPADRIDVDTIDGTLRLQGTLADARLVERVVERTRRVAGGGEVVNLLRVSASPCPRADLPGRR